MRSVDRVDVVWDTYIAQSLKETTRQKRETGVSKKVAPGTKIPKQWVDFLRNTENKKELFLFLSSQIRNQNVSKAFYMTEGEGVVATVTDDFPACGHEEEDTGVVTHVLHAAERGYGKIVIRILISL